MAADRQISWTFIKFKRYGNTKNTPGGYHLARNGTVSKRQKGMCES